MTSADDVSFRDRYGLHGRAAMRISQLAGRFLAATTIAPPGGNAADARSLISLVSSGIRTGDVVRVAADGPDETEALAALRELLETGVCHP